MNNKEQIIDNLKETHSGKKVNINCAINGTDDSTNPFRALDELIQDGFVRKYDNYVKTMKGNSCKVQLYQYNFLK